MVPRYRRVLGWCAVGLSTVASCFWAFWGIIENFHEGWYYPSLRMNLAMMVGQYLLPMLLFVGAALVAIRLPRVGGMVHVVFALWAAWHFRGAAVVVIYVSIVLPLLFMGVSYWMGRPQPIRWAVATVVGLPLLTVVVCGMEPVHRVSTRYDDGERGIRLVQGNEVELLWAPPGPGWPDHGVSWYEAVRCCQHLSADGLRLEETAQNVWRLPTIAEVVRSSYRRGRHASGTWDGDARRARFQIMPDKEPPLWDRHSKIIYWWTGTEVEEDRALRFSYNGHVMPIPKRVKYGYLGFRAVKEPSAGKDR
jgi:hypothetical protein